MEVYIYQADLYCAPCGEAIRAQIDADHGPQFDPDDKTSFDSDEYPKGPYGNGGGESDTPCHCFGCGVFLENPLTDYGRRYVKTAMRELKHGHGSREIVDVWRKFYGINY